MTPQQWANQTKLALTPGKMQRWSMIVAGDDGLAIADTPEGAIGRAKNAIAFWAGYPAPSLSPLLFGAARASRTPLYEGISLRATLPEVPLVETRGGAPWSVDIEWHDPEHAARTSMPWPVLSTGWFGRPIWAPDPRGVRSVLDAPLDARQLTLEETESTTEMLARLARGAAAAVVPSVGGALGWLAALAGGLGALWIFLNRSKGD